MVRRPVKSRPFPWQRTKTRWCRLPRRYGQHGRESVQRGDVGRCPALEEVVFAEQLALSITPLSSRKGDTAYRTALTASRDLGARNLTRLLFKPPAGRRPWQARSTHPRTTGHRHGSHISPL